MREEKYIILGVLARFTDTIKESQENMRGHITETTISAVPSNILLGLIEEIKEDIINGD